MRFGSVACLVLLAAAACEGQGSTQVSPARAHEALTVVPKAAAATPSPWSAAWMEQERERYLGDAGFRRRALEESLTNHKNVYSRTRLSGYGRGDAGWDLLPAWVPVAQTVDAELVETLAGGVALALPEDATPIWDGQVPTRPEEWVALGRRVFFDYPLRSEVFAEHALRNPEVAARVGLRGDQAGLWPGVVAYRSVEGEPAIGISCALCHVSIENGRMVEGRARRDFDYGEMRLSYYRDTGTRIDAKLARRMAKWGPGRADITPDDDEDPVAIVDLWGLKMRSYLTQSGTLRHKHPAALAIRQETQILQANQERIRAPRILAWALAMYLYSIEPPPVEIASPGALALRDRGELLFTDGCRKCHSGESFDGALVAADTIGTDGKLAKGHARGTGRYRPAPLLRVAQAGPYLHDGSVGSLEELFDAERVTPGHRFGTELGTRDKEALIAYLKSL